MLSPFCHPTRYKKAWSIFIVVCTVFKLFSLKPLWDSNVFTLSACCVRQGKLVDSNPAVRKVPVKIVHQAESNAEREVPAYPLQSEVPAAPPLASLGSPEPSYSLFCTYTRPRDPEPEALQGPLANPPAPQEVQPPSGAGSEEDRKREELARDILGRDKSLADILDQTKMKTTMDLMEGIFPQGEQLLEGAQQRRKVAPKRTSPKGTEER